MVKHVNGLLSSFLRSRRISSIKPYVKGDLLDFGCNTGDLSQSVFCRSYTGIDVSEGAIKIASKMYPNHRFYLRVEDVGPRSFDTALMMAVIEYIPERIELYKKIRKVLKANGILIITSPNPRFGLLRKLLASFKILANDEKSLRIDLPSVKKIESDLNLAGLKVIHSSKFLFGVNLLIIAELN